MIPQGWRKIPIGNFCKSLVPGRNKPKVFDGEIPWITTPEIFGRYLPSKLQQNYVSPAAIKESGGRLVPANAVVITCVGDLGTTAITTEDVVLNQQLHAFVPPKDTDVEYLAYQVSAQVPYMMSVASTTTIPYMNKGNCESIPILLPPIVEQREIAAILGVWDRAIETVEALIANARAQKQALMQQLLPQGTTAPKKRLPGFSGEWRETSLAELLSVKRGKGKIVPTNEDGDGVPYIGSTSFLGEFSNYTTSDDALLCVETDILVLWDGEYAGKVATGLAGAVSSTVSRYRLSKAKADPLFVVTLMEKASERIRSIREGSGIPHMPGDFEHWFKFALPPLDEQQAIAEVFKANRVIADEVQSQLTALRQEKAALMQQLLTGKRRVKVPESEVTHA